MLRTETETPGRRTIARLIGSCDLVDNALGLVVS